MRHDTAVSEIGFLFGQYKRIANRFTGILTGKGPMGSDEQ
jgi:glutamate dehydrogenase/leucine dehydrogenase